MLPSLEVSCIGVNPFDSYRIHDFDDHTTTCVPPCQLVLSLHQPPIIGLTPITFALGLRAIAVSLASLCELAYTSSVKTLPPTNNLTSHFICDAPVRVNKDSEMIYLLPPNLFRTIHQTPQNDQNNK